MRTLSAVLMCLLVAGLVWGQTPPPSNLQAELMAGGEVQLTWDAPTDGLNEDFEDGVADDFGFYPDEIYFAVEDGFLKMQTANDWQCAWYTALDFTDFDLEATFENVTSNSSRGLQFRADGPRDNDYNGFNFYVAYTSQNYSIYNFIDGSGSQAVSWTGSDFINTEVGETNTLRVVGSGNTFDLYINGNLVNTFTDASHPSGMVGAIGASSVVAWYDYITCAPTANLRAAGTPFEGNRPSVACDESGMPVGNELAELPVQVKQGSDRDIDDFIEYIVYRDGSPVGTADLESFTDNLPGFGEYTYLVTASYDEGESDPSNAAVVNYDPATLDLVGQFTQIPPEGGTVVYDITLVSNVNQTYTGVDYWTEIEIPTGQVFNPVDQIFNFTVGPFANVTVTRNQNIPAMAPGGEYILTGHVGFYPNSQISDSFTFNKSGAAANGAIVFDPEQWQAGGMTLASDDPVNGVAGLPDEYALSAAYPNPFNPSTSFSVTLPETAELTVAVYNVRGQLVATLADGISQAGTHEFSFDANGLASGLYFVNATVPGQMNEIRKVTLLR